MLSDLSTSKKIRLALCFLLLLVGAGYIFYPWLVADLLQMNHILFGEMSARLGGAGFGTAAWMMIRMTTTNKDSRQYLYEGYFFASISSFVILVCYLGYTNAILFLLILATVFIGGACMYWFFLQADAASQMN